MVSTAGRLLIEDGRLAVTALLGGGGRVLAPAGSFGKLGILIGSDIGLGSPGLWRLVLTWIEALGQN